MVVATSVVAIALAALLTYSAIRKLTHKPRVVQSYTRVGVPEDALDYLAFVLLLAAAGLVLGVFSPPIGIAAAIGVIVYFAVAIAAHIRAGDAQHVGMPLAIFTLAAITLVLRIVSL